MVKPKISVIIPCYNVADYVVRCVKSITNQEYDNLEIICINDGSTDNTLSLLTELQQETGYLKVINQANKGLSESRNVGMMEATGDYIMFVDSDDWLEKNAIVRTFEPGLDLIAFSYNRIFKNSTEPRILNLSGIYQAREIQRRILGLIRDELKDPSQTNSLVTAWAKIYNNSIIKANNIKFTDTRLIGTEDALFNLQYLEFCSGKVKINDFPFYNYLRFNEGSLTSNYKPNLKSQWQELHKRMAVFAVDKNDDFQEAYRSRVALSLIGLGLNEMERKEGYLKIYRGISEIINEVEFKNAIKNLDLHYLPLHWKVLFKLAKLNISSGVFVMMKLMHSILKRKNA